MKYLCYAFFVFILIGCGQNKENKVDKAQKEHDSTMKVLEETLAELEQGIVADSIKYDSDDCSYWIEEVNDDVVGTKKIRMREAIVFGKSLVKENKYQYSDNNIELDARLDDKQVVLQFHVVGLTSCVDEDAKINILFTDDTRLELKNEAEFNCDAHIAVWFNKGSSNLEQLKTKTIKTIRATIDNKYFDIDCLANSSVHLNKSIACLIEKAK